MLNGKKYKNSIRNVVVYFKKKSWSLSAEVNIRRVIRERTMHMIHNRSREF